MSVAGPRRLCLAPALGGGLTGIGGPLVKLRTPLIAAVHGYVLGGGFELAMCADIIVAADDTKFGLPETKAGIIGECGVMHRAIRQLPYRVAMAMILTGERLSAADALRFGLVNEVTTLEGLNDAATGWAERRAASPLAVQAAKEAVTSRTDMPLEVALATRFESIRGLRQLRGRPGGPTRVCREAQAAMVGALIRAARSMAAGALRGPGRCGRGR